MQILKARLNTSLVVASLFFVATFFFFLRKNEISSHFYANIASQYLNKSGFRLDEPYDRLDCLGVSQTLFEKAENLNPKNDNSARWLAAIYQVQGLDDTAFAMWRKTESDTTELLWWGRQAFNDGKFAAAQNWFEMIVALQPDSSDGWYELGLTQAKLEEWLRAVHSFEKSVLVNNFKTIPISSGYYRLALGYHRFPIPAQPEAALSAYNQALLWDEFQNVEEKADAYYGRAELLRQDGDFGQALLDYQQALQLNSRHEWAWLGFALTQYAINGDGQTAKQIIQETLNLWPEQPSKRWPYYYLATIYENAGQGDLAIENYKIALSYDPNDQSARERLEGLLSENSINGASKD